jgi:ribosomal protein S18 acetylase RimI-like enzyme
VKVEVNSKVDSLDMKIRPFQLADQAAVIELWQRCGLTRPWNDPHKDIQRKLRIQPELFLVGVVEQESGQQLEQKLVATVMAGYEGHRGWINYLAVAPEYQQQGLGQAMMAEVERQLQAINCPKINIQVRSGNQAVIAFYQRLGYAVDDVISLGKRLESDMGVDTEPEAPSESSSK